VLKERCWTLDGVKRLSEIRAVKKVCLYPMAGLPLDRQNQAPLKALRLSGVFRPSPQSWKSPVDRRRMRRPRCFVQVDCEWSSQMSVYSKSRRMRH